MKCYKGKAEDGNSCKSMKENYSQDNNKTSNCKIQASEEWLIATVYLTIRSICSTKTIPKDKNLNFKMNNKKSEDMYVHITWTQKVIANIIWSMAKIEWVLIWSYLNNSNRDFKWKETNFMNMKGSNYHPQACTIWEQTGFTEIKIKSLSKFFPKFYLKLYASKW